MEGTRLGAYRIESELGSGGMGRVYLATDEGGTHFAIKVVHPHLLETPGFFKRFLREAEVGKAVEHRNVVRCFDADAILLEGRQHNFLVMEYVEGQTLRDLLDELERVPEELCRHVGREVAEGLAAIHEAGIVHRDLKPENVLITPEHEVKIMDLGVARLKDAALRLSLSGAFVGSPLYASPEQFKADGGDLDGRTDLFSLGVLLYELSSGEHPHPGDDFAQVLAKVVDTEPRPLAELNPQLSAFFEEVVHKLLAKDREKRFGSAAEVIGVLDQGEDSLWWGRRAAALRVETKRPLRRIRIPRETGVWGREKELTGLRSFFDKAKAGDGQVVLIEGEAGIGKTRLLDELIRQLRLDGEDLNFLFGSYPPGGAATAAGAWSTAYREHFGAGGSERYLSETPILVPAFDSLLRGEPAPEGQEPLTKDSIHTVFVHATRALAEQRTTVVLIEDLHYAPAEGRALLAALSLAVPEHRILLVGTSRPGLPKDWIADLDRLEHVTRMPLGRLGPKDLGELLVDAFRSKALAEELGFKISVKSDGNPFFVFEIIRALREGKFITRRPDGTWVSTQAIEEIEIPSSVTDLIKARISDLGEEQRNLLEVASCCGFEFDPLLVGDVLGLPNIPLLQRLATIEKRHRLVRSAGRRYQFDHHQVREGLYEGMPELLREAYHESLGDALGASRSEDAVSICGHFLSARSGEKALPHLESALDQLERGYLHNQAVELATRALALSGLLTGKERAEVLLRVSGWLDFLGRRADELANLDEARTFSAETDDLGLRARVHRALGTHLAQTGRYDDAQQELEEALRLARAAGDRTEESRATGNLGSVLNRVARSEEALELQERSLAIAREIGDLHSEGMASANLGSVLVSLGRREEARAHFERLLEIAGETGSRRFETTAEGSLGYLSLIQGRLEEARERIERQLALSRETGLRSGEAIATGNLGRTLFVLGLYEQARENFERWLVIAQEVGDRHGEGWAHSDLAMLLLALGHHEEARERHDASTVIGEEIGDPREEGHALNFLAELSEREGDFDEALLLREKALARFRELEAMDGVSETLIGLGRLESVRGREEAAAAHLCEALAVEREAGVPWKVLEATVYRALLPGGEPKDALAALEALGDRAGPAVLMKVRFHLFRATGDRAHLGEAHRLLETLRSHAPEESRETMIANVPIARDIVAAWEEQGNS